MGRIDDIRSKIKEMYMPNNNECLHLYVEQLEDIEYLLSKIEIAERSFNKIEEMAEKLTDDLSGVLRVRADTLRQTAKVAKERMNS